MTSAGIQPFYRKYNMNIGCYDGFRVYPRNITERNIASKLHKNHFCLIWKPNGISFNQVIADELKSNFKVIDSVVSDKHVKSFVKNDYKPKKVQSELTHKILYDLETCNTIKCVPYSSCI